MKCLLATTLILCDTVFDSPHVEQLNVFEKVCYNVKLDLEGFKFFSVRV